ncbi:MAG: poly(A) polymerase [Legionellales bacterium RIFCSPHIGHO2_12_FULL_37_14]|nr:MAG: poly(A) polymerase [Legionellales bacterium RIFCSPHIGHO2_12_FULL_37_14]
MISLIKRLLGHVHKPDPTLSSIEKKYLISRQKHRVSKAHISPNALTVINKLRSAGFEAYVVGGCIRDLLVNKQPKDFDVATNATPAEVRKLFRNARIIGRRFKLIHVWFQREIIEVATFRAGVTADEQQMTNERGMIIRDNAYGNIKDDAFRRDFTINSLYYAIESGDLIDLTGGVPDIKNKQVRIIGKAEQRYQEDPVRMLRAIRFAAKLDFTIEENTKKPLYNLAPNILHVAPLRLFEEVTKLYQCGHGEAAHNMLLEFNLFSLLFPATTKLFKSNFKTQEFITLALKSTDARIRENKPVTPAFLFAVLLWFPLQVRANKIQKELNTPPLTALEQAMSNVLTEQNRLVNIPRRFLLIIREIWILQFRFHKRLGGRAQHLLTHPRFRAAYDFLAIRALAKDAPIELADWWTEFQEKDELTQELMVKEILANSNKKPLK